NGRIDPMDVIEIDNVGPEPPEALPAGFVHIFRPAVREAGVAEQPEIAKLTRDDVIAAVPSDRLGYELLVAAAAVAVAGIEKIDADLARPPARRDPRGAVGLAVGGVIVPQPRPTAETSNCPSRRPSMPCL